MAASRVHGRVALSAAVQCEEYVHAATFRGAEESLMLRTGILPDGIGRLILGELQLAASSGRRTRGDRTRKNPKKVCRRSACRVTDSSYSDSRLILFV
jgi:hypothetical protein